VRYAGNDFSGSLVTDHCNVGSFWRNVAQNCVDLFHSARHGNIFVEVTSTSAVCIHCRQTVVEGVPAIEEELRTLRVHLLGCPPALAACAPAYPGLDRDVLRHFDVTNLIG
jgi:hypothetical protein